MVPIMLGADDSRLEKEEKEDGELLRRVLLRMLMAADCGLAGAGLGTALRELDFWDQLRMLMAAGRGLAAAGPETALRELRCCDMLRRAALAMLAASAASANWRRYEMHAFLQ